jgi:hypothetical protein
MNRNSNPVPGKIIDQFRAGDSRVSDHLMKNLFFRKQVKKYKSEPYLHIGPGIKPGRHKQ